jgi:DNA-binding MarR family transcriptional regulator
MTERRSHMTETTTETADDALSRRVMTGLAKLGLVLRSQARAAATKRGLSTTQGEILALLLRKSGVNLSEVAHALSVTRPTASDAVDALVRKGLVDKNRSPKDPRALSLVLTSKGQREARRASSWPDALQSSVESLSPEEQAAWLRGLMKLLRALESSGALHEVRACPGCAHLSSPPESDAKPPHRCAVLGLELGEADFRIDCPSYERPGGARA